MDAMHTDVSDSQLLSSRKSTCWQANTNTNTNTNTNKNKNKNKNTNTNAIANNKIKIIEV
jgi:hypothetical protein